MYSFRVILTKLLALNKANDWSVEIGIVSYIFDLLLSVINVSLQTVEIVEGLPKVKFE